MTSAFDVICVIYVENNVKDVTDVTLTGRRTQKRGKISGSFVSNIKEWKKKNVRFDDIEIQYCHPYVGFFGFNDWMVFYAPFNSISVILRRQLTLFMSFLGCTSTRLGLWIVLPKGTSTKTQRIRCGSNPGHLDYESKTLPLTHAGPLFRF